MGVTGIEGRHAVTDPFPFVSVLINLLATVSGVYRRSAEIALRILRANKDSLRSVLETFLHDPLVEWISRKVSCARMKREYQS